MRKTGSLTPAHGNDDASVDGRRAKRLFARGNDQREQRLGRIDMDPVPRAWEDVDVDPPAGFIRDSETEG